VLQSGGEEGMWTYERYQRWMDQVTDWVRPPTATALRGAGDAGLARPAPGLRAARPPAAKAMPSVGAPSPSAPASTSTASRPSPAPAGTRPAPAAKPPSEDVIEVPAEEMDLAALAELAKKVVERKP
jgi:hypothetical protein